MGCRPVEVDWNEQAAKSAENYLNFTSFSKAGLIDQLIFEGFTRKQAEFGVSQTGL
ncbi:Ltp family lipoprotein [Glutamicibacter uratoxydans]|uniref:Ltp family lipoprotein n=1 Tax=Glutamicibacter uratoxydans TaxID=43667 RepID=UPI003D6E5015